MNVRKQWLIDNASDLTTRQSYMSGILKRLIAAQIKSLRVRRGLNQKEFGEKILQMGGQSLVARMESPNYGKMGMETLIEIAARCGIGIIIKFVQFDEFCRATETVAPNWLNLRTVDECKADAQSRLKAVAEAIPHQPRAQSDGESDHSPLSARATDALPNVEDTKTTANVRDIIRSLPSPPPVRQLADYKQIAS